MRRRACTTRWSWDAQGQLLAEEGPDGPARLRATGRSGEQVATPWGALARRTDAAGRVTTLESPAGTFRFSHDDDGRVTRVRAPNGVVTDVLRDAAGREVRRTARGRSGPVLELSHDARRARPRHDDRPRRRADRPLARRARPAHRRPRRRPRPGLRLERGRRPDGRHPRRGRSPRRPGDERFEHDGAGRVTRRVGPAGETRYGWDPLGRLTRVERIVRGRLERRDLRLRRDRPPGHAHDGRRHDALRPRERPAPGRGRPGRAGPGVGPRAGRRRAAGLRRRPPLDLPPRRRDGHDAGLHRRDGREGRRRGRSAPSARSYAVRRASGPSSSPAAPSTPTPAS
jgi:YD repeat-containing protein